jgi:hypothetical protein
MGIIEQYSLMVSASHKPKAGKAKRKHNQFNDLQALESTDPSPSPYSSMIAGTYVSANIATSLRICLTLFQRGYNFSRF